MTDDAFTQKEKKVIRYDDSVPYNIRADYKKMFSEMPQDFYRAVVMNYSSITITDKIRKIDSKLDPYFVGYTSSRPPTTYLQFTGSGDSNKDVRPYHDLKGNLHHELAHLVYADYAAKLGNTNKFLPEAAVAYREDLKKLGFPKTKPVQDYFLPGGPFDANNDRAKEAFCEIVASLTNGGDHDLSRPDGRAIDIAKDFPKTYALAQQALQSYISRYDPQSPENVKATKNPAQEPDTKIEDMNGSTPAQRAPAPLKQPRATAP